MNRRNNILFFVLELISGIGIGILGTYLVMPMLCGVIGFNKEILKERK